MNDERIADELVKLAALIRLKQVKLHPRTRYLLLATLNDHQEAQMTSHSLGDAKAMRHGSSRLPIAQFIHFYSSPEDRYRRDAYHKAQFYGRGDGRIYDPEFNLTIRIHSPHWDTDPRVFLPPH